MSSFVRTNLKYDLIPKQAKTLLTAIERMKQLYPKKSGIVYCLSRLVIFWHANYAFTEKIVKILQHN